MIIMILTMTILIFFMNCDLCRGNGGSGSPGGNGKSPSMINFNKLVRLNVCGCNAFR